MNGSVGRMQYKYIIVKFFDTNYCLCVQISLLIEESYVIYTWIGINAQKLFEWI